MKLGEMLVRDGHVTPAQVEHAVERQGTDGGRMGTVLVETGAVDLDTITVYLGLELSLPVASGAMLDRAKRTAVRLLTPEQAHRFRCIPLLISERQLIAAVHDPHDMMSLDELSKLTGYRVIPRVAPEIRIYYYLERYYGVARPERFRIFGDTPRGKRKPDPPKANASLPGPSLPGLPPKTDAPVEAPGPAPVLRATTDRGRIDDGVDQPSEDAIELIRDEAEQLIVELEADDAETADEAPPSEAFDANQETHEMVRPETFAPLEFADASARMGDAAQRGEVADALMCHARSLFDVAALFIVRDNLAFGWKGFGSDISRDRLEAVLIPLDAPSIFQSARKDEHHVHAGNVFPAAIHRYLYKVLRTAPPRQAVVVGITIGGRMVNMLYGHKAGRAELSDEELGGLRALAGQAATAYARLIAVQKDSGRFESVE